MVSSTTDTHCQLPSDNLLKPFIDQVNHKFPSLMKLLTTFLQSEVPRVHSLVWKFVGNWGGIQLQTNPVSGRWRLKSNLNKRESFLRRAPTYTCTWPRPSFSRWRRGRGRGRAGAGDLGGTSTESTKARESLISVQSATINRCESLSSQNHIAKLLE